MNVEVDHVLDQKGECCPMPVLNTRQKLDEVGDGEVLEVVATDPGAEEDLKALSNQLDMEFLGIEEEDGGEVLKIYIRK